MGKQRRLNHPADIIWSASLHDVLVDVGLPAILPSLTVGPLAVWREDDLGRAKPSLAPTLVQPILAAEAPEAMGTYVAYGFADDRRVLVVEWRHDAPRRAIARIVKRRHLGRDYVPVVEDWEDEYGPGTRVLIRYPGS